MCNAKSSNELAKYEYLIGEDLGYKPSVVEQAKFDYSTLGKAFNKGLTEEGNKEGLLRSVKNIRDKNEKLLKATEDKNEKQLKAIENKGKKQLDAIKKNNELKDDKGKNETLLKDGLKELIQLYLDYFSTFVKSELKQPAISKENIDYKKLSQEIFFYGFSFLKKYDISNILLKNLVANTININTVNDDQRNFVFHLMKGYNVSSFFKTIEIKDSDNKNL